MGRLLRIHARAQAVLVGLDESADDAFDPRRRLTFAEDDFGKAAAVAPVKIDLREPKVGNGLGPQRSNGLFDARPTGTDAFQ